MDDKAAENEEQRHTEKRQLMERRREGNGRPEFEYNRSHVIQNNSECREESQAGQSRQIFLYHFPAYSTFDYPDASDAMRLVSESHFTQFATAVRVLLTHSIEWRPPCRRGSQRSLLDMTSTSAPKGSLGSIRPRLGAY